MIRRALIRTSRPLRKVDVRLPRIERFLGLALSEEDIAALRASMVRAPANLGMYYHWYLQKALIARLARDARPKAMHRALEQLDRTDYTPLHRCARPGRGLLVCVPHHGHYAFSMIGMLQQLDEREALVFYASPSRQAGNAVFDALHERLFGGEARVRRVHDTTKGMGEMLRGLRRGAVVLLMPDAVPPTASPYYVQFAGRQLPVMLGPAVLARKTGATVLAAVSRIDSAGTFRTCFGVPREYKPTATATDDADVLLRDYRFVAALFRDIECLMSDQFLYWQHVRSHFSHAVELPTLDPSNIRAVFRAFLRDPRIRASLQRAFSLD